MDYDVIYIGSGNASWQGARFLRKNGLKILIVEESLYGGACANRGCNSKALLDAPYEIKALADNFEGVGKAGNFEVDWPSLMKLKRKLLQATGFLTEFTHLLWDTKLLNVNG